MFGYVRPLKDELKVKELDRYQGAYCGLCHAIGAKYGFWARMTLNYDFTLLAILFSPAEQNVTVCQRRCPVHPLRKKGPCVANAGLEIAADECMILAWQKLRDDCMDKGLVAGLPSRLAVCFLKRAYRKAAQAQPEFDRQVTACLTQLHALEQEGSVSMDQTADTFARLLQAAAPPEPDEGRRRAMEQLLYHLGRWIYLVDAWDDLGEDRARNAYNPLLARFDGRPEEQADYVRTTLSHSVKLAISAFQLLDLGGWSPIVENILYLGLPTVQEAVLIGRWRELQKQTGR